MYSFDRSSYATLSDDNGKVLSYMEYSTLVIPLWFLLAVTAYWMLVIRASAERAAERAQLE